MISHFSNPYNSIIVKRVMRVHFLIRLFLAGSTGFHLSAGAPGATARPSDPPETIPQFTRDVRPILSRHCFKCHGPDSKTRKAGLRLDIADEAYRPRESGDPAVAPGDPGKSELIRKIFATDEAEIMPPPETKNRLTETQKQTLKQWILSGGKYEPHWAFQAPKQVQLPEVNLQSWPRNSIDNFVLSRLEREGLQPSPSADAYTLIKRLYLDLIGILPMPEEIAALNLDATPESYERLVDHLLASPHYGERWARPWLDLARYADTNEYEKDRQRSIWPYRDWVINALNTDMPFDQFTIEQIAGDMLPGATRAQRIATGFHRNTMLNEEGGIDPLEFRFHAVTDRVSTTGKVWLGLTIGCAQCHTHKFDPISQQEYYQFMAFLNNADEPELDVPDPDTIAKQESIEARLSAWIEDLPNQFPAETVRWQFPEFARASTDAGQSFELLPDKSIRFTGNPETDVYTVEFNTDLDSFDRLQIEALTDSAFPKNGPGRSENGNFVLTDFSVTAAPKDTELESRVLELTEAEADFSQKEFPIENAIDDDLKTGWAIQNGKNSNANRSARFSLRHPFKASGGARLTVKLSQLFGKQHTIGRIRFSAGQTIHDPRPIHVRRGEHLETRFKQWQQQESSKAVPWTVLRPIEATSNLPILTILDDNSVLASGDQTKSDTYELLFRPDLRGITAIRLEAMPDDRLPRHGPGRVYYEGPIGDFTLCEFKLTAGGREIPIAGATHSFASGEFTAAAAIDGNPQTGWSVNGRQGEPHEAIFNMKSPITNTGDLRIQMLFERHFSAGLGRFRIAATAETRPDPNHVIAPNIESILLTPEVARAQSDQASLRRAFLLQAPELSKRHEEIENLRKQIPKFPTTLVMEERPANEPRPTHIHNRGEFLQPTDKVSPEVLSILPSLPDGTPRDRLSFARWLVSSENPLVGRVTINRQWESFFGYGLVTTPDDFGYQGELPTHPELLEWLAVEFVNQGWSLKKMHKLIVMSATYQQSSDASREQFARDPENRLIGRGPRVRIEAELIRDSLLAVAGSLSPKIGGPSVFPPQPANITTEGTYGQLRWNVSEGEGRFRRGLYTFSKRTAPYAMFTTFDAPSGEACVIRRETSNTPLQALTLLNDSVFTEAAQSAGRIMVNRTGSVSERIEYLFQRCLTRPPTPEEAELLRTFFQNQKQRFESGALNAKAVAGDGDENTAERAAWTVLARALFNLDETITKG